MSTINTLLSKAESREEGDPIWEEITQLVESYPIERLKGGLPLRRYRFSMEQELRLIALASGSKIQITPGILITVPPSSREEAIRSLQAIADSNFSISASDYTIPSAVHQCWRGSLFLKSKEDYALLKLALKKCLVGRWGNYRFWDEKVYDLIPTLNDDTFVKCLPRKRGDWEDLLLSQTGRVLHEIGAQSHEKAVERGKWISREGALVIEELLDTVPTLKKEKFFESTIFTTVAITMAMEYGQEELLNYLLRRTQGGDIRRTLYLSPSSSWDHCRTVFREWIGKRQISVDTFWEISETAPGVSIGDLLEIIN